MRFLVLGPGGQQPEFRRALIERMEAESLEVASRNPDDEVGAAVVLFDSAAIDGTGSL